jgi:hypothetical protein
MGLVRKVLTFPLMVLIFLLERITKPMWDFAGGCFVFWLCFKVVNSGVEPGNISNALRVVFWDTVLGIVAFQTLPELFFKMFSGED